MQVIDCSFQQIIAAQIIVSALQRLPHIPHCVITVGK